MTTTKESNMTDMKGLAMRAHVMLHIDGIEDFGPISRRARFFGYRDNGNAVFTDNSGNPLFDVVTRDGKIALLDGRGVTVEVL